MTAIAKKSSTSNAKAESIVKTKSAPKPAANKPVDAAVKTKVAEKKVSDKKLMLKLPPKVAIKSAPKATAPAKVSAPAKAPVSEQAVPNVAAPKPPAKVFRVKASPAGVADAGLASVKAPIVAAAVKTPVAASPALKPGRRSSVRAASQLPPPAPMLPTHSPDAAKATYSTVVERVIAPPPHVAAQKDPKLANNWITKSAQELTDDEVKAMSDDEYMNEKQLAFFRHKLSLLKQDIHNSAGKTTEHLREDTVVVPDPADRATIEEEHALELRTRDRERKLLKKIEQSITRIDTGDYGFCDETGEPIGVGRLIARPTANLSLEAQQRRELKQKMFGD